jgi:hypothetical protein
MLQVSFYQKTRGAPAIELMNVQYATSNYGKESKVMALPAKV